MWHAARAEDGRGPATALAGAVAAHFGQASVNDVITGLHLGSLGQDRMIELSEVLFAVFEARDRHNRPSLVYCGDDEPAKETAARLIRDVGFDPVDAGPLLVARHASRSHCPSPGSRTRARGPALAYRFEHPERP
jgi:hypothetical protein